MIWKAAIVALERSVDRDKYQMTLKLSMESGPRIYNLIS